MILDREYHEDDTSPAELEALRGRVTLVDRRIVRLVEIPRPTEFSARVFGERIGSIDRDPGGFALLVDLSEAGVPSARVRDRLREDIFGHPDLVYGAIFTGRNAALTVVAKLVVSLALGGRFSVSSTEPEALARAREALANDHG